jgi:hypothetical protein
MNSVTDALEGKLWFLMNGNSYEMNGNSYEMNGNSYEMNRCA